MQCLWAGSRIASSMEDFRDLRIKIDLLGRTPNVAGRKTIKINGVVSVVRIAASGGGEVGNLRGSWPGQKVESPAPARAALL